MNKIGGVNDGGLVKLFSAEELEKCALESTKRLVFKTLRELSWKIPRNQSRRKTTSLVTRSK